MAISARMKSHFLELKCSRGLLDLPEFYHLEHITCLGNLRFRNWIFLYFVLFILLVNLLIFILNFKRSHKSLFRNRLRNNFLLFVIGSTIFTLFLHFPISKSNNLIKSYSYSSSTSRTTSPKSAAPCIT